MIEIQATKAEFKENQNKIVKLQAFDSSYFLGKNHFDDDGTQNHFKKISNSKHISAWKSKGFSDESLKPPGGSYKSLAPVISHINTILRVKFDGSRLNQGKVTFL